MKIRISKIGEVISIVTFDNTSDEHLIHYLEMNNKEACTN